MASKRKMVVPKTLITLLTLTPTDDEVVKTILPSIDARIQRASSAWMILEVPTSEVDEIMMQFRGHNLSCELYTKAKRARPKPLPRIDLERYRIYDVFLKDIAKDLRTVVRSLLDAGCEVEKRNSLLRVVIFGSTVPPVLVDRTVIEDIEPYAPATVC